MKSIFTYSLLLLAVACKTGDVVEQKKTAISKDLHVQAESFVTSKGQVEKNKKTVGMNSGSWLEYKLAVPVVGRFRVKVFAEGDAASFWLEDHVHNTDDRTYDITGQMMLRDGVATVDGSPMNVGPHNIRLHLSEGTATVDSLSFELMNELDTTSQLYRQSMEGDDWELVWSDEFDGEGLPDTSKWNYMVGNWGWGNNELQYYTDAKLKNARQENGSLILEAHKNDGEHSWSSARLSTQGRASFMRGRVEFRAKVPPGRGAWAAGWLLGDTYRDELSWPYCGEIDVLECVGYEINDTTGRGKNHATCHTPAYYFKKGNQIGSEIVIDSLFQKFHVFAMEWYPDRIEAFLDGEHYYTYDKTADKLEWPFFQPQNIILNVAVGGGWGGAKGVDPKWEQHRMEVDYVRVYEKK